MADAFETDKPVTLFTHGDRNTLDRASIYPEEPENDNMFLPSLMTQLPCDSGTGAASVEQRLFKVFNTAEQGSDTTGHSPDAGAAKKSIIVRPRISTNTGRRSHRAVSVGPVTSPSHVRMDTGQENASSRPTLQSGKQSGMCHGNSQTGAPHPGALSTRPRSRFSRQSSRHACQRSREPCSHGGDGEWGRPGSHAPSNLAGGKMSASEELGCVPEGLYSSPEASTSLTPGKKSVSHQEKDPADALSHQPAPPRGSTYSGGGEFVSDSEASPERTSCPRSQHGREQLDPAGEGVENDAQALPSLSPTHRKPSLKSVKYQVESEDISNRKLCNNASIRRRSTTQLKLEHKGRVITCEFVALALAELGAEVARASQCVNILKVCADYGTDLPLPLRTMLESLAYDSAPLDWRLDSLRHTPHPGAPKVLNALFWRPYMWRNQLDLWLRGVKQQLRVLEGMATAAGFGNLFKPPEPDRIGWELSAVPHPQALVATAKRLFAQTQSVPLQTVTCTAILTSASAYGARNLGSKKSVVFSLLPTGVAPIHCSLHTPVTHATARQKKTLATGILEKWSYLRDARNIYLGTMAELRTEPMLLNTTRKQCSRSQQCAWFKPKNLSVLLYVTLSWIQHLVQVLHVVLRAWK